VFQAHRLVCHSTLGVSIIKKKKKSIELSLLSGAGFGSRVQSLGFRVEGLGSRV